MRETPEIDTSDIATLGGEATLAVVEKDWEQFDACARCNGRAPIDETEDGNLFCHLCGVKLPRPSS